MSPGAGVGFGDGFGFPRVSGDEPLMTVFAQALWVFSPRERG